MNKCLHLLIMIFLVQSCTSISQFIKKVEDDNDLWGNVNIDRIKMYFKKGSVIERDKEKYALKIKDSFSRAEKFSQIQYQDSIKVIILENSKEIKDLLGVETSGISFPDDGIIVEIAGVINTLHEKMHLLTIKKWGMPKKWLSEGMAVYSDNKWWGEELYNLSNYLKKHDKRLPLNALQDDKSFDNLNNLYSYPQSGSLVKYIDEIYGRKKLLELWKSNNFEKVLGINAENLIVDWEGALEKHSADGIDYLTRLGIKAE